MTLNGRFGGRLHAGAAGAGFPNTQDGAPIAASDADAADPNSTLRREISIEPPGRYLARSPNLYEKRTPKTRGRLGVVSVWKLAELMNSWALVSVKFWP